MKGTIELLILIISKEMLYQNAIPRFRMMAS